jgi:predicted ATPase
MDLRKKISISNFRIFKEQTEFELAPITILTGANNSGKSTFIKATKLLVESAEKSKLLYLLNGSSETKIVNINTNGNNENIVYDIKNVKIKNNFVDVIIKYKKNDKGPHYNLNKLFIYDSDSKELLNLQRREEYFSDVKYEFRTDPEVFLKNNFQNILEENSFFKAVGKFFIEKKTSDAIIDLLKEEVEKSIKISGYFIDGEYSKDELNLIDLLKDIQLSSLRNDPYNVDSKTKTIQNNILQILDSNNTSLIKDDLTWFLAIIEQIWIKLCETFDNFIISTIESIVDEIKLYNFYLPATRGDIKSEFDYNDTERLSKKLLNIITGHKKIQGLDQSSYNSIIEFKKKSEADGVNFELPSEESFINDTVHLLNQSHYKLFGFTNETLKDIFSFPYDLFMEYNEINKKYEILFREKGEYPKLPVHGSNLAQFLKSEDFLNFREACKEVEIKLKKYSLSDTGSGIFHLLSILIEIELAIFDGGYNQLSEPTTFSKSSILIEEPEISLHPNYQSKLADVFALANKRFGVSFIIETHSEYLVRKLQYLVAKKELVKDDILIYYIENFENQSELTKIEVKESGYLSQNFGPGFFDESDKIALELFLLKQHQSN